MTAPAFLRHLAYRADHGALYSRRGSRPVRRAPGAVAAPSAAAPGHHSP